MLVNSVPLSLTIMVGRLRSAITPSTSRATRMLDGDVSATRQRHSAVKSSTTANIRNRRLAAKTSDTKSRLQRGLALVEDYGSACSRVPFAALALPDLKPFLLIEPSHPF